MVYFTINELCYSATAQAKGINNTPNDTQRNALVALVDTVLDPLRRAWGKPILVNSGYRCPALNKLLPNASPTSQHMRGEAADITTGSPETNRQLYELAVKLRLPFDQLIGEKGCRWLHISHKPTGYNRHQYWTEP